MDKARAAEIFESLGVVQVTYKGKPIWIEEINEENDLARVRDINTHKEITVDIKKLEEI